MKKLIILLLTLSLVITGGCGKKTDEEKGAAKPPLKNEDVNFEKFGKEAPDNTNLVIIVSPTEEQKQFINVTESYVMDKDGQEVYIMPRETASKIEVYSLSLNKISIDLQKEEKLYSAVSGKNGCLLIKTIIPEGLPAAGVYVTTPSAGELSYIISYDGKGETNVYYR